MKVAIVGSRDFPSKPLVEEFVNVLTNMVPNVEIVSGGAKGVDTWAVEQAKWIGNRTTVFPANWAAHGWGAAFMRNYLIVNHADVVVAFWFGRSRGTQHTLKLAKYSKKPAFVYEWELGCWLPGGPKATLEEVIESIVRSVDPSQKVGEARPLSPHIVEAGLSLFETQGLSNSPGTQDSEGDDERRGLDDPHQAAPF